MHTDDMNAAAENLTDFYQSVTNRFRKIDEAKFWSLTKTEGKCLIWKGAKMMSGGYGRICIWGKSFRAHRYSYLLNCGPIPKHLVVCHKCDNPLCVNPEHLFLGTHMENMIDRQRKGRTATGPRCIAKDGHLPIPDRHWHKRLPHRVVRGVNSPNAKLTEEQVQRIRNEYGENRASYRTLATKYGVSWTVIMNVITGKSWKHVP